MKVENLEKLVSKLRDLAAKARKDAEGNVIVGYTQNYALHVHENIEMKWRGLPRDRSVRVGAGEATSGKGTVVYTGFTAGKGKGLFWGPTGQAKFLEQPARELSNSGELARIVSAVVMKGKTLMQGLLLAGLRIQRESQQLVPVDTGALRASAFTRLE